MPAEAPCALQWPGCRNAAEAFLTRLGGVSFLMLHVFYTPYRPRASVWGLSRVS